MLEHPSDPLTGRIKSIFLRLHVFVEEHDGVPHRLDLYWIGIVNAFFVTAHIDESVFVMIVGFPPAILAGFLQQII